MPEHGIYTNIPHREASAFYPLLAKVGKERTAIVKDLVDVYARPLPGAVH
jgi:hypothetical protein